MTAPTTRSLLADRTLRTLLGVTFLDTLGRSSVLAVLVLFLTTMVGLSAAAAGFAITVAGAAGVLGAYVCGHLADRLDARRLVVVLHVVQGSALAAYACISNVWILVGVACVALFGQEGSAAVRSTLVGRMFGGGVRRAKVRGITRSAANIGIGVGTSLAAVPLALQSGPVYRIAVLIAGAVCVCAGLTALRLPAAPATSAERAPAPDQGKPYRDRRYVLFAVLVAAFTVQMAVLEIGMPLWIVHHTEAPAVTIAPLIVTNTILVIVLQVPLGVRSATVASAGRAWTIAGALFALCCVLYAAAGSLGLVAAVAVLVCALVSQTLAEILFDAASTTLGYELARPDRLGGYMGLQGMGLSLGVMLGPLVVTQALSVGALGWGLLAGYFALATLGVAVLLRTSEPTAPEPLTTGRAELTCRG